MKGSVSKHATQRSLATPIPARLYCDFSGDIVFVVVDPDSHRPSDKVLDELAQATLAIQRTLRTTEDIVTIWQKTGGIGGGVGGDIENVPDVSSKGQRSVLERKTEGCSI